MLRRHLEPKTYTSNVYRLRLRALGFTVSMSRKGNCWENAVAESTIGSVKAELLEDWIPASQRELTRELLRYVEAFYNK